jgi:3-hydroxyacyl-[acyl-carrier-protein] dehydratase
MNVPNSITAARVGQAKSNPDGTTSFQFQFRSDDPVFAGHFPGRPLLPGVFQLEMARAAAQWVLNCALDIREISRAKFVRPILPDEIVDLQVTVTTAENGLKTRARFSVGGQAAGETSLLLCRRT